MPRRTRTVVSVPRRRATAAPDRVPRHGLRRCGRPALHRARGLGARQQCYGPPPPSYRYRFSIVEEQNDTVQIWLCYNTPVCGVRAHHADANARVVDGATAVSTITFAARHARHSITLLRRPFFTMWNSRVPLRPDGYGIAYCASSRNTDQSGGRRASMRFDPYEIISYPHRLIIFHHLCAQLAGTRLLHTEPDVRYRLACMGNSLKT